MADEADQANDHAHIINEHHVRAARAELPPGEPGECEVCGDHSPRLVRGVCAPCRDEFKLD